MFGSLIVKESMKVEEISFDVFEAEKIKTARQTGQSKAALLFWGSLKNVCAINLQL